MTRRIALQLLMGLPAGVPDLRVCGVLTKEPQYLTFDLRDWAGVKVLGPNGEPLEIPSEALWQEMIR